VAGKANHSRQTGQLIGDPKKKSGAASNRTAASIILITAVVYARAVFNDFSGFDDDLYIIKNPLLREVSWETIRIMFSQIYFTMYHPLTIFSYWVEYSLFGANPHVYHFTNVGLHLLNTFLVFRLAEGLSGKKVVAVLVSLLFALHPMHVESVAWISERKDVLYSFFYLLALVFYLRYLKTGLSTRLYCYMGLAFIASLLAKPAAVTLPVVLIAMDLYLGRRFDRRAVAEKIPLLILSLAFGLVASFQHDTLHNYWEGYSMADRVLLLGHNIAFYLVKLVAPVQLSAIYYYPLDYLSELPWTYYASIPFLLVVLYLLYRWKSHRKEILFGTAFFLVTISVMLQFIPFGLSITGDRYTYIPYIGLFYLIAQWVADVGIKRWRRATITISFLVITLFAALTFSRIGVWKDGETLFSDVIKKYPDAAQAYWFRGSVRAENGYFQEALSDYDKAVELEWKRGKADAAGFNARGDIRYKTGDLAGAFDDFNTAIQLNDSLAAPYMNRSLIRANSGDIPGALADVNKAIELLPFWGEAYNTRGAIRTMMNNHSGAIEDFTHGMTLDPGDTLPPLNLGIIYLNTGDTLNACQFLDRASTLGSRSARIISRDYCR